MQLKIGKSLKFNSDCEHSMYNKCGVVSSLHTGSLFVQMS